MLYVIGDIHGYLHELSVLINQLKTKFNPEEDTLIFIGDYIDRGPNSPEVVDLIIDLKTKWNVRCLCGNHEDMFLSFMGMNESNTGAYFLRNGGTSTVNQYYNKYGYSKPPEKHLDFFSNLEHYIVSNYFVFVHGGIDHDDIFNTHEMMWIREPFFERILTEDLPEPFAGKIIVHGHTPLEDGNVHYSYRSNKLVRINIDTGIVFGNHITLLSLNDDTGEVIDTFQSSSHLIIPNAISE